MVKQFTAYATGMPAGFADRAEVELILDGAAKDRYGLRTLMLGLVQSQMFTDK